MIEIVDLYAGYGGKDVLKGISCLFERGSQTAVLGPNGAGKSTLLKCICGYLPLHGGGIAIKGKKLGEYFRRELAREVAIIPQKLTMQFDYEVQELVMMGRYPYTDFLGRYDRQDRKVVKMILERLELEQFTRKNFSELSGGEQQRVMIARALAQETDTLLLDESFANLDVNHSIAIMELLQEINRNMGKTIVIVSHNINLAVEYCPEALIMKDGKVYASGKTEDVVNEEILTQVYEHPLQVIINPASGKPNLVYKSK